MGNMLQNSGSTAFASKDMTSEVELFSDTLLYVGLYWVAVKFDDLTGNNSTIIVKVYQGAKTNKEAGADGASTLTIDTTGLTDKVIVYATFPQPFCFGTAGDTIRVMAISDDAGDNSVSGEVFICWPFGSEFGSAGQIQADVVEWNSTNVDTPATAGVPNVNTKEISGDSTAADNLEAEYDGTGYKSYIRRNTAQAGAAGTITLDASASATDDLYNGLMIALLGGTGAGQARMISDYVGSTKVATIEPDWTTNPGADSVFVLLPMGEVNIGQVGGTDINVSGDGYQEVDAVKVNGGTPMSTADINTQVDNALNTAIPDSPTAESINERLDAQGGGGFD
jgi:hypothetical protein